MRWFVPNYTVWDRWFAWRPIVIHGRYGKVGLWLCWVQRRRVGVVYEYREIAHA